MTDLRPDLPPLPQRMRHLKLDHRGFPVPWFVQWMKDGKPVGEGEGEPDFRVMDSRKFARAMHGDFCWVCGGRLGLYKAFTIGAMCAINRINSEPPSHRDCAIFSATGCPFLSRPRMRRNEKDLPAGSQSAGYPIMRNPGAACVWITRRFTPFRADFGNDGVLFKLGDPVTVLWFANGRRATRAEVMESIDSGYPILLRMAQQDGADSVAALEAAKREVLLLLLPPELEKDETNGLDDRRAMATGAE